MREREREERRTWKGGGCTQTDGRTDTGITLAFEASLTGLGAPPGGLLNVYIVRNYGIDAKIRVYFRTRSACGICLTRRSLVNYAAHLQMVTRIIGREALSNAKPAASLTGSTASI